MVAVNIISYTPPPTIKSFIKDYRPAALFYDWIIGPVGSGKTTGLFFKLIYMAKLQQPGPDGIRRTRAVIVRNTMPQLKDTTLVSWNYWFKDGVAGSWHATTNRFVLRFDDVECEVLFRPLDTAEDIARVLSLEVTFAIIDEFVQIPKAIIEALSARLGRYPARKDGGATNWGMWGSSNPDTEDNWWFEFLHNNKEVERIPRGETDESQKARRLLLFLDPDYGTIHHYYRQPSGFSPDCENWENLPGERDYYVNQAKGKTEEWIKQFIEAEWGFSISGKPVIASFKPTQHVSKTGLRYNPHLPLIIGVDPGLAGSALIYGQQDLHGRLLVLGEQVQSGYGAERLVREKIKPYVRRRFPEVTRVILAPDPAANSRTQTDERTVVQILRKYFEVSVESNNRLPLRVNAIDYFTTRLVDVGPALLIDEAECPILIRALKGGWRYAIDPVKDKIKGADPEKNGYSHPGDSFGYLARYFHRQSEREERNFGVSGRKFVPPRKFGPSYHYQ